MPYIHLDYIEPEYAEAAADALNAGHCPDCPGDVRPLHGWEGKDGPATVVECVVCDTEWAHLESPAGPGGRHWKRSQRQVSVIAMGTGRHPDLARFTTALTTAAALDPDDAPVFVSIPMGRFPATAQESDRMRRRGLLLYYPPSHLHQAQADAAAAGQAAARPTFAAADEDSGAART